MSKQYAATIKDSVSQTAITSVADNIVTVAKHGRVHSHTMRGLDDIGSFEQKTEEDESCASGLINPATFVVNIVN